MAADAGRFASRRPVFVLLLALLTLAAVLLYQFGPAAGPVMPSSNHRMPGGTPPGEWAQAGVTEVQLDALAAPRPQPPGEGRNPFAFARQAPASASGPAPGAGPPAAGPRGLPGPAAPPDPAIGLKFIGIVESAATRGPVAVLSDGRFVFHGREGDIIEGRYRIVRIGVESIVMERLDGSGRETIRLTG